VGALVSSPPAEKEVPTAELPKADEPAEEPQLSTSDLEMTTADTLPLEGHPMADTLPRVEQPVVSESSANVTPSARLEAMLSETRSSQSEGTSEHEGRMEPGITDTKSETQAESADVLLDLGELEHGRAAASDDFVLDLDDGPESAPVYEAAPAYEAAPLRAFVEPEVKEAAASAGAYESNYHADYESSYQEVEAVEPEIYESHSVPPEFTPDPVPVFGETEFPVSDTPEPAAASMAPSVNLDQLSPEMIDAIARRAVELMSDKVIREIAWEVVPDLAELLIKRQLEERSAK
jgi:hypothetical protein